MGKRVTIVIRDRERQYEGLRYSLGLLFENHEVTMIVLNHEVEATEEYVQNVEFIEEMGGRKMSNVNANIELHGFDGLTDRELEIRLTSSDLVVPF